MGALESSPRHISMINDEMSGITVTSDVIKRFGNLDDVVVTSGSGVTVEFVSGKKYIDFDDAKGQLDILEEQLTEVTKKGQPLRISGLEILAEHEVERRQASEQQEEQQIEVLQEEYKRRVVADEQLVQQCQERIEKLKNFITDEKKMLVNKISEKDKVISELGDQLVSQEGNIIAQAGDFKKHKDLLIQENEALQNRLSIEKEELVTKLSEKDKTILELDAKVTSQVTAMETQKADFEKVTSHLTSDNEALQSRLNTFLESIESLNQESEERSLLLTEARKELLLQKESLQERIMDYEVKMKNLEENSYSQSQAIEMELSRLQTNHSSLLLELDEKEKALNELQNSSQLEKEEIALQISEKDILATALNKQIQECHDKISNLESTLEEEKAMFDEELNHLTGERALLSHELQAKEKRISSLQEEIINEKEKLAERHADRQEQYKKGVERVKGMLKPLQQVSVICPLQQSGVLKCYSENIGQPLKCSEEVIAYCECVRATRLELLTRNE